MPNLIDYNFGNIPKIVELYKKGYLELLKIIQVKNIVGQNAAQKNALMAQVDQILNDLDKGSKQWVEENIPDFYRKGSADVIKELEKMGEDVKFTAFSQLHQDAIKVIGSDTYMSFANGLQTVRRDVMQTFSQALKTEIVDELAKSTIAGTNRKELVNNIQNVISNRGISSLVDKGGKRWQLDTYAEMLARTKSAEATRIGGENRQLENGHDLAQVTVHFGSCINCMPGEGKIYSLTGRTPGYPTLDQIRANAPHLFAPNCRHRSIPYVLKYNKDNMDEFKKLSNKPDAIDRETLLKAGFKDPNSREPMEINDVPKVGKSITLEYKGKKESFSVNEFESKFITDKGVRIESGVSKRRTSGDYTPGINTIYIRTIAKDESSLSTFYHELGHAIDFKFDPKSRLIHTDIWSNIPTEEKREVVINRIINSFKGTEKEKLIDRDAAKDFMIGLSSNGLRFSPKHIKYLRKYEEILADGYAQYRINKEAFKAYAPKFFEFLEGLK